jgi:hypothetical protein
MPDLEYLTDSTGTPTAVVIPIALWRQLLPHEDASPDAIGEALEDYWALVPKHGELVLSSEIELGGITNAK